MGAGRGAYWGRNVKAAGGGRATPRRCWRLLSRRVSSDSCACAARPPATGGRLPAVGRCAQRSEPVGGRGRSSRAEGLLGRKPGSDRPRHRRERAAVQRLLPERSGPALAPADSLDRSPGGRRRGTRLGRWAHAQRRPGWAMGSPFSRRRSSSTPASSPLRTPPADPRRAARRWRSASILTADPECACRSSSVSRSRNSRSPCRTATDRSSASSAAVAVRLRSWRWTLLEALGERARDGARWRRARPGGSISARLVALPARRTVLGLDAQRLLGVPAPPTRPQLGPLSATTAPARRRAGLARVARSSVPHAPVGAGPPGGSRASARSPRPPRHGA